MNSDFAGGTGRCVTHPDNLAGGTCTRCGNFLCYLDTEGGRFTTCEPCRSRTGVSGAFPLNRTNYSFGALWDYCWPVFKQHWLMLSVGLIIPGVAVFVMSLLMNLLQLPLLMMRGDDGGPTGPALVVSMAFSFGLIIVMYIVLGALMLGYFRMCHDVIDGGQPDVGRMFSQFAKTGRLVLGILLLVIGSYLAIFLIAGPTALIAMALREISEPLSYVGAGVFAVVGYVAFIYVALPFYMFLQELAYTEVGVIQGLKNCWNEADGFRWSMILVGLASIPITLLGLLACCIGVIPAYALSFLLYTGLHRALRSGAEGVTPA